MLFNDRKELLIDISNTYKIKNPYLEKGFDMRGRATYSSGVTEHELDNVITFFDEETYEILIKYDKDDSIISALILLGRCNDFFFSWLWIEIQNKKISGEIEDDCDFIKENMELILGTNVIKIKPRTVDDFYYAKDVLVYKNTDAYPDEYFFLKEYERWETLFEKTS
jgi:hypothetical protein